MTLYVISSRAESVELVPIHVLEVRPPASPTITKARLLILDQRMIFSDRLGTKFTHVLIAGPTLASESFLNLHSFF